MNQNDETNDGDLMQSFYELFQTLWAKPKAHLKTPRPLNLGAAPPPKGKEDRTAA